MNLFTKCKLIVKEKNHGTVPLSGLYWQITGQKRNIHCSPLGTDTVLCLSTAAAHVGVRAPNRHTGPASPRLGALACCQADPVQSQAGGQDSRYIGA